MKSGYDAAKASFEYDGNSITSADDLVRRLDETAAVTTAVFKEVVSRRAHPTDLIVQEYGVEFRTRSLAFDENEVPTGRGRPSGWRRARLDYLKDAKEGDHYYGEWGRKSYVVLYDPQDTSLIHVYGDENYLLSLPRQCDDMLLPDLLPEKHSKCVLGPAQPFVGREKSVYLRELQRLKEGDRGSKIHDVAKWAGRSPFPRPDATARLKSEDGIQIRTPSPVPSTPSSKRKRRSGGRRRRLRRTRGRR
jgi:hypothetical protein